MMKNFDWRELQAKMWPEDLVYYRQLSSGQVAQYVSNTRSEQRVMLFPWGVIEAFGPQPLAADTMMADVITDMVAQRLHVNHGFKPIIFNIFKDVGCPSATWRFPGSIGYSSHQVPVIPNLWTQTIQRLVKDGFRRFVIMHGDGGNERSHGAQLMWLPAIRELIMQKGGKFEQFYWCSDGAFSIEGYHGGTVPTAMIRWMMDFAPEFVRFSALRHGLVGPSEEELQAVDGTDMKFLEFPPHVNHYWSEYSKQRDGLYACQEFDLNYYRKLLFKEDGQPREEGDGGLGDAIFEMVEVLTNKIVESLEIEPE